MAENPIPPVDPIVRTSRVIGTLRHAEAFDPPPVVDTAMRREWQEALARELAKKKAQAVNQEDRSTLRRWRDVVRSLWPRRRDADASAEPGAPGETREKR